MQRALLLITVIGALVAGCVPATLPAPLPAATQSAQLPAAQPVTPALINTITPASPATSTPTVLPAPTLQRATMPATAATTPASATPVPVAPTGAASTLAKPATGASGLVTVPTPEAPVNLETPGAQYVLQEEQVVGPYVIRMWHDKVLDLPVGMDVTTISVAGRPQIVITGTSAIGLLNGQDLTGEGMPDIVIEKYSGGAHCCFGTVAYRAGSVLTKILDLESGNCAGSFQDLDKNGVYEFVTCDDSFAYTYCSYAASPKVKVIYEYKTGQGYRPRSPNWFAHYAQDITDDTTMAQTGKPRGLGEWDGTNKCSVLPLTLDYLYSGQTAKAWDALKTYYKGPDLEKFQAEIDATVRKSPMYVTQ